MLITFTYANLMVSMAQVNGAKNRSPAQMVKQVYNSQNREHIKLCLTI